MKAISKKLTLKRRYKKLHAPPPTYKVNRRYQAFSKASVPLESTWNGPKIHTATLEGVICKEAPLKMLEIKKHFWSDFTYNFLQ